jgi:hypothetical protein
LTDDRRVYDIDRRRKMAEENGLIFHEEQRFPGWLRCLVVLNSAFFIALMLFLLWFLEKKQVQPLPTIAIVVMVVVPMVLVVLLILFCMAKLETRVRSDGLYVRFFPFHIGFKKFFFEDFSRYYTREYHPVLEYGGWGIRYGLKSGKAYNVEGNKGLQIIFKNGKKLLIGSEKPWELVTAIDSVIKGKTNNF